MSNSINIVSFLKKVPLFYGLSDRQLKKLANRFVARTFSDGNEIVTQGEKGLGIFIVVSGEAEAIRENKAGEKISVNTFTSSDFFGELALLHEGTRTATVFARGEVECLALPRWEFIALLKEDAEMAVCVAQELAKRFRNALNSML